MSLDNKGNFRKGGWREPLPNKITREGMVHLQCNAPQEMCPQNMKETSKSKYLPPTNILLGDIHP